MIREELRRLLTWEERHRRLVGRLGLALVLTIGADALGAVLTWLFERGARHGDVHGLGDALFFATTQILTVSSSMQTPLTAAGRVVDVGLELWAVFIVTAVAGSFASFFRSADV